MEIALANILNSFNQELPSRVKKEDIDTHCLRGALRLVARNICLLSKEKQMTTWEGGDGLVG